MQPINIPISSILPELKIKIRITGLSRWKAKNWVAMRMVYWATRIADMKADIIIE